MTPLLSAAERQARRLTQRRVYELAFRIMRGTGTFSYTRVVPSMPLQPPQPQAHPWPPNSNPSPNLTLNHDPSPSSNPSPSTSP